MVFLLNPTEKITVLVLCGLYSLSIVNSSLIPVHPGRQPWMTVLHFFESLLPKYTLLVPAAVTLLHSEPNKFLYYPIVPVFNPKHKVLQLIMSCFKMSCKYLQVVSFQLYKNGFLYILVNWSLTSPTTAQDAARRAQDSSSFSALLCSASPSQGVASPSPEWPAQCLLVAKPRARAQSWTPLPPHGSTFNQLLGHISCTTLVSLHPYCCSLNLGHHHCRLDWCNILPTGFPMPSLLPSIHFSCCSHCDFLKNKVEIWCSLPIIDGDHCPGIIVC